MDKKKILFLITQSVSGGAQKYVFDLTTNLDKEKYEVAVAAGGSGPLLNQLEAVGIKNYKLKWLRRPICPVCDIMAYFEIKRLLNEFKPDILHLNSSKAGVLGSLAAKNLPIKVVYTVHGAVFEASFSSLAKKLFLWAEKLTAKYKHKIICVSVADRRLWLKYNVAPPEKLVTIHNGINLNIDFLPKEQSRKEIFQKYSQNFAEYKIVGTIAHFYPEKNLPMLIDASTLIYSLPQIKDKKIIFAVIGDGPQKENLKSKIKNLKLENKFLLPGALPDAAKYLKAFDIFVFPSLKEGLPYAILQAMAAEIPIVASRVGGIPEMIQDSVTGFLILPQDKGALAEKILQLLESPELAKKFAQRAKEKISEFSLEQMLNQTEAQY